MDSIEADKALISALGGVTKLAERLHKSVQVVSNWNKRGIPAKVKLAHPELFLPGTGWDGKERRKAARSPA